MRMTTPTTEVRMRGDDREDQGAMWSYVPMERRIPADHPLRPMRPLVDTVLRDLSPRFAELYSRDCAGEAVARPVAAGAVHDPELFFFYGAAPPQPPLSLLPGPSSD